MNARILGYNRRSRLGPCPPIPTRIRNSKKVEQLFKDAETDYERSDYENAIAKYKEALKESKKFGTKTEHIDKDFTTFCQS